MTENKKLSTTETGAATPHFFQQAQMPQLNDCPGIIRLCCGVITNKRHYDPAIALSLCSVLPAYTDTRVTFKYPYDIEPQRGNLISFICAPFSSGKSYPLAIANAVLKEVRDKDTQEREKEDKMKDRERGFRLTSKEGKKKVPKRKNLNIQLLPTNSNSAAFLMRQKDLSHFHSMGISLLSECDNLKRYAGGKDAVSDLIRSAYECGWYAADRVLADSISGGCNLMWTVNCATTHAQLLSFLGGKEIENGTLSRCVFAEIHTDSGDDTVPVFRSFDEDFYAELKVFIDRLKQAKPGVYEIPELHAWVEREMKKVKNYAVSTGDEVFMKMSYRVLLSAARVGFTLWLTEGMTWTKGIDRYITYLYQSSLDTTERMFGEQLKHVLEISHQFTVKKNTGKPSLLPMLAETFTLDDLIKARVIADYPNADNRKTAKLQANGWKKNKLTKRIGKETWQKITPKPAEPTV